MGKTKAQLIGEIEQMRQRIAVLEKAWDERGQVLTELKIKEDAIASSINAVALSDLDGKLTYVNNSFLEMWGYESQDEVLGRPAIEFWKRQQQATSVLEAVVRKGGARGELVAVRKDGSTFSAELSVSLVTNDNGEPLCIMGSFIDMTERKRVEEALRLSEERYRSLVEIANECIVVVQDGVIKFANPKTEEVTGYAPDELASSSFVDYLHPDDREMVIEAHVRALKEGKAPYLEPFRMVAKNGDIKWLFRNTALIDWEGKPATLTFLSDITESKVVEEALRESEEKYRSVVERASDLIVIIQDGVVRFVNERGIEMLGYTPEEAIGTSMVNYIHPEAVELTLNHYQRRITGEALEQTYESALLHKEGRRVDVEVSGALINYQGRPADMVVIRDITERKQAEEALRYSEDKFRAIFESIGDAITVTDLTGTVLDVNKAALEVFGLKSKKDAAGRAGFDFIAEKSREKASEGMMKLFEEGSRGPVEYTFQTVDGREFEAESSNALLHDANGNPTGIVSINRDITERKRVEEELRKSEEKLRFMFESLGDGIIVVDLEGRIVEVNEATLRLAGCTSREDMIGRNVFDFVAERDRARAIEENTKNIAEGHGSAVEYTAVDINGNEFDAEAVGALMRDSSGNPVGFITAVRDVTERKRIEEALRESEERYRSVVETASDAIISIDSGGHIIFWNPAAEAIFGYSTAEAIGQAIEITVPERFRGGFREGLKHLTATEGSADLQKTTELIGLKKDGSEFPVEHSITTWQAKGKGFHTAIIRDITERKRAEEALRTSEEKLRIMFESITDGIIVTDLMGNIVDVNEAAIRLHGYGSREDLVGYKGLDLISEEYRPMAIEKMFKALEDGGDATMEYALSRPDGMEVDVEGVVNLLHDSSGEPTGLVVIIRNITERKRAEENLKLYVEEITRAQEEERKRIARELHDETVQELAALTLDIEATKRADKSLSRGTANALESIQEKSRSIMEGVNRFSAELRPDILDQMGLLSALSWLVENIGDDIDVRVESSGDERRLAADVELAVFRVAQEALSNVRKHSEAIQAVVKVAFTDDGVRLEVRDYGKGFTLPVNIADLATEGHLGILGMHERARIVDGTVSVRSRPGEGTSVSIVV